MKENINSAQVAAEWIRRPLVDLGGSTPLDSVNDPEGRRKLEDLLVELAGHHVRLTHLGLPSLDVADIRKALGIEAAPPAAHRTPARVVRPGPIKRNQLLDELGTALTGGDVDSVAYYNVKAHAVEHFMHNLGDQENARIAEAEASADMQKVTPVTTEVRYGIMSDFISLIEDINVAGKLRGAISGKGAFRRFREAVDEDDMLRRRWLGYRTKRHYHIALDWLNAHELAPPGIVPADYDWEPQPHAVAHATAAPAPSAATSAQQAATAAQQPEAPSAAQEVATPEAVAPEAVDAAAEGSSETPSSNGEQASEEAQPSNA